MLAAKAGNLRNVKLLLEKGATHAALLSDDLLTLHSTTQVPTPKPRIMRKSHVSTWLWKKQSLCQKMLILQCNARTWR